MLEEAGADLQDSEGIIDTLQSIGIHGDRDSRQGGLRLDSCTKISVRTREPIDATDVCTPFGGGGHRRAAGAEFRDPLAVAERKVLEVARRLLDPVR